MLLRIKYNFENRLPNNTQFTVINKDNSEEKKKCSTYLELRKGCQTNAASFNNIKYGRKK